MSKDLGPKKKRIRKHNPVVDIIKTNKNIEKDYQSQNKKEEEYIVSLEESFSIEEERFGLDEDEYLYVLMEDDLV